MKCIDASVAAKWVIQEEHSSKTLALLEECLRTDELLVAPALLHYELTNILRQRMSRYRFSQVDAQRLLAQLLAFPVTMRPNTARGRIELHDAALRTATEYELRAAYDAHYIALAQMFDCTLWTDDRRLLRSLDGRLDFVRWIGDFEPSAE